LPLREYILYELHIGTFTREGTFDAAIRHLGELKELGITALEIMPVAQFPGERNWGYDGAYPYAPQNSYGGPEGLKRLVNAAHEHGLAVLLDVVYNHLGPEGNYLSQFAPYFTTRYKTPWGAALNFDGPDSDHARRFFLENALYWQNEFHFDGLRLDAVHAIRDESPHLFLEELVESVHHQAERLNRRFYLVAESDMNNARTILPPILGGYGMDAQWSDDFHHSLHVLLTGEKTGYYQDFDGLHSLALVFQQGFAFTGQYSAYRRRRHGNSPRLNSFQQFVVCAQNHDQVGNRMLGERLSTMISFEQMKLAAGAVLLSPFIPMLFMGEEYGETAHFQYFISHLDEQLVEAVRKGRNEEFASFRWTGQVPDPFHEAAFQGSKLNRNLLRERRNKVLLEYHQELIRLRKTLPAIGWAAKDRCEILPFGTENTLFAWFWSEQDEVFVCFCFSKEKVSLSLPVPEGKWRILLDSSWEKFCGPRKEGQEAVFSNGKLVLDLSTTSLVLAQKEPG
jgi:maltooligosyltrehalose trehalohydrolase